MIPNEKRQEIFRELARLRLALEALPEARDALDSFDDYVEHHEFGIALYSACDRLRESGVAATAEIANSVAHLQELMELGDDATLRLL